VFNHIELQRFGERPSGSGPQPAFC